MGRWVHSGALCVSLCLFWFVEFVRVRPGGDRVHSCSFGHALEVVWFIRVRCVRSCTPWGSSGSFAFVGLILARNGGQRDHLGSLG